MSFENHQHANGVQYMTSSVLRNPRHAFSTRYGGVSQGWLAGLNLSVSKDPSPECVFENYRLLGEATGIDTAHMAFTKQVHGADVRIATEEDVHVLGTPVPYETDGIVTNVPGLALICFTADCVPVLLSDAENNVIGAIHCGWRSSVADILKNAVEKMCMLGAVPSKISAAIGPAISACCFEVGPEVVEAVQHYIGEDAEGVWVPETGVEGKSFLDLKEANRRRLVQLGLTPENIDVSPECTVCSHEKYWSHRYTKGKRGSQGALIVI